MGDRSPCPGSWQWCSVIERGGGEIDPRLPPGFGTIWTAVAIDLVGFGIVLPILPLYAKRFHTTSLEATLLVSVFSAASLVCSPLWGRVSDRFGRKPVLLVSLAGTAVGSLITGLAGGLAVLLVGRIVDGASGASVSVAQAAAADLAGPADRARLFGLLGAAFGVGFVAGPALGSLAALGGPRLPFFLAAGIADRQHRDRLPAAARNPRDPGPGRPSLRARQRAGGGAHAGVTFWPWWPSAASRPPSPSSGRGTWVWGSPPRPRSSRRWGR